MNVEMAIMIMERAIEDCSDPCHQDAARVAFEFVEQSTRAMVAAFSEINRTVITAEGISYVHDEEDVRDIVARSLRAWSNGDWESNTPHQGGRQRGSRILRGPRGHLRGWAVGGAARAAHHVG